MGAQVADALAYVHDQGVVHRDVTPANVLCSPDGRALLADFGIARLIDTSRVTAAATTVGTAAYMAPEQVQGLDVTPAADVYSLGLVLLELLTGRKAFTGTAQETAVARLVRDPDTSTDVPDAWRDLLRDMTERAPSDRPSAAQVRDRLRAMLLIPTTPTARSAWSDRRPWRLHQTAAAAAPPDALTTPAPTAGGTAVMPAALLPSEAPRPARTRLTVLAAAVVGLLVIIGLAAVAADDDGANPARPPSTTEPVAVTSPPTTAPPTTEAPVERAGKPKDPGPGHEKGDGDKKDNGPGAHDD